MGDMSDVYHGCRGGTNFRRLLDRLIGDTVRVQTDSAHFTGKLADVETTFVTVASRSGGATSVTLVYIPIRHINAVSDL